MPVEVEIPTTVIGLVAMMIIAQWYIIYHLLKQLSELNAKFIDLLIKVLEGLGINAASLDKLTKASENAASYANIAAQIERLSNEKRGS
jgi:hypothetical protein